VIGQKADGYGGMAALLPPPEKRALVLIDPPYETAEEWTAVRAALRTGLKRLPAGLYAVWYPLTARAGRTDEWGRLRELPLPPTLSIELRIDAGAPGLTGCGLLILNPPWGFAAETEPWMRALAQILGRGPEAGAAWRWLVPE
jgi:23S rRNA (adenine2030-N6)-methyltransferase